MRAALRILKHIEITLPLDPDILDVSGFWCRSDRRLPVDLRAAPSWAALFLHHPQGRKKCPVLDLVVNYGRLRFRYASG